MKRFFTTFLGVFFGVLIAGSVCMACPGGSDDVTKNGAVPDDRYSDSEAIQQTIDEAATNGVVCIPAGEYFIDDQIQISRDDLTITGEGADSILRLSPDVNVTIFRLGADEVPATADNITIEKLSLDGAFHTGLTSTNQNFFGIWMDQSSNVTVRDISAEGFLNEAIIAGNGHIPNTDILIERVRVNKASRNSIAIGFAEGVTIRNCVLENNQDPESWGEVSGNAIDIEVEGDNLDDTNHPIHEGWVYDVTIEDNLFTHNNFVNAGYAVQLAPAYGLIDGVTIQRNVAVDKGIASVGSFSRANANITMDSNWVGIVHTTAACWAYTISGTNYGVFQDNVATDYSSGYFVGALISHVANLDGDDNSIYLPDGIGSWVYINAITVATPYTANSHATMLNTFYNGPSDNKIIHWDWTANPNTFTPSSVLGVASSQATWVTNSNSTPDDEDLPSISSASLSGGNLVVSVSDPNSSPVRVVALRNGFPIGMKTAVSGTATIPLPTSAVYEDYFEVRVYNQHGIRGEDYTFTY